MQFCEYCNEQFYLLEYNTPQSGRSQNISKEYITLILRVNDSDQFSELYPPLKALFEITFLRLDLSSSTGKNWGLLGQINIAILYLQTSEVAHIMIYIQSKTETIIRN
jgi:hypothetical protein